MLGRPPLGESVMGNVSFDTCVYHQPGINLLFEVIDPASILSGRSTRAWLGTVSRPGRRVIL
jgi:hypothetical protein